MPNAAVAGLTGRNPATVLTERAPDSIRTGGRRAGKPELLTATTMDVSNLRQAHICRILDALGAEGQCRSDLIGAVTTYLTSCHSSAASLDGRRLDHLILRVTPQSKAVKKAQQNNGVDDRAVAWGGQDCAAFKAGLRIVEAKIPPCRYLPVNLKFCLYLADNTSRPQTMSERPDTNVVETSEHGEIDARSTLAKV